MDSTTQQIENPPLLISRCKNGDNSAFKEIYQLFSKAMFNISMRIVNRIDEAEDILQESFLKAFQNIKSFENEAAFGSWLKRVVVNNSIDFIRKQKCKCSFKYFCYKL